MKKNSLPLIVFIFCFSLFACTNKPSELSTGKKATAVVFSPTESVEIDCTGLPKEVFVPLPTAKEWIKNYQDFMISLQSTDAKGAITPLSESEKLNAFTFRTSDFLAVLGVPRNQQVDNTRHLRGYMGLDKSTAPYTFKLILVAALDANVIPGASVQSAGKDAYFTAKAGTRTGVTGKEDEGFALDLNYPCPTLCPPPPGTGSK